MAGGRVALWLLGRRASTRTALPALRFVAACYVHQPLLLHHPRLVCCRYLKDDPSLAPKRSRPSYEGGSYGGYPAAAPPGVAPPPGAYAYGPPAGSAPVGVVAPVQVRVLLVLAGRSASGGCWCAKLLSAQQADAWRQCLLTAACSRGATRPSPTQRTTLPATRCSSATWGTASTRQRSAASLGASIRDTASALHALSCSPLACAVPTNFDQGAAPLTLPTPTHCRSPFPAPPAATSPGSSS